MGEESIITTSDLGINGGEGESKATISWILGGSGLSLGLNSSTYCLNPGANAPWRREGKVLRLVPYFSKIEDLKFSVLSATMVLWDNCGCNVLLSDPRIEGELHLGPGRWGGDYLASWG